VGETLLHTTLIPFGYSSDISVRLAVCIMAGIADIVLAGTPDEVKLRE
jgi:hypothetical protein